MLLEQAVNHAPRNYQARALLVLGSVTGYRKDYKAEAAFYRHALRLNTSDTFTTVEANRAIAISKAVDGDHKQAVKILESVLQLAHYYRGHNPYLYLHTLNSLAVEYQAVGRLREALELARIATASPLASFWHEFSETRAEIEREIVETQAQAIAIVVPARLPEQKPQPKVIIRFLFVESRARRKVIKPTIRRTPVFRSMIERVATVAPIHAPPFEQ
jgi:tetratricopeptide (TPR) repeat protein